jgi:RAB protein geranylgeranyltransferase component A
MSSCVLGGIHYWNMALVSSQYKGKKRTGLRTVSNGKIYASRQNHGSQSVQNKNVEELMRREVIARAVG